MSLIGTNSVFTTSLSTNNVDYFSSHVEKKNFLPRKEVIHPQLPLRMPCYDLVLVTSLTLDPLEGASGTADSLDLTGGEYKTRERIHRGIADPRLLAIPAS